MKKTTLKHLRCPQPNSDRSFCARPLALEKDYQSFEGDPADVRLGMLTCPDCGAAYPILGGVLILVQDVASYILEHVKGISRIVPDEEIPEELREDYLEAKADIPIEHIEEDLEAERVVSLYVMNHFLHANEPGSPPWWTPLYGESSPLISQLITQYWDQGPLAKMQTWIEQSPSGSSLIELGAGVGGLYPLIKNHVSSYLGVDSSFASVALGRSLALGAEGVKSVKIPEDLLRGPTSREIEIKCHLPQKHDNSGATVAEADLIVGDLSFPILATHEWDISVSLNAIDMLNEPSELPKLQKTLLKAGGVALQSCPYIWHESVAKVLRSRLPDSVKDSARAVEWLYQNEGFTLNEKLEHVPWLFFKQVRQLELYSVHMFNAKL